MRLIKLSKGYETQVDDELYPALSHWEWHYTEGGIGVEGGGYAATRICLAGVWRKLYLHRFLMKAGQRDVVDHIDCDRLNNQKNNLRIISRSANNQNSPGRRSRSALMRGVYYSSVRKKFESRIAHGDKSIFLGRFKTEIDAARAYDAKALEIYGPDAMTNEKILQLEIKKLQAAK